MDSGRFEFVSRPYAFHQVMRGLFVPLRLATDARNLELVTDLDPCIDRVGFLLHMSAFHETRHMTISHIFLTQLAGIA